MEDEPEAEAPDDIRATIAAAMTDAGSPAEAPPAEPEPAAGPERPRAPDGKFVKAEGAEPTAPAESKPADPAAPQAEAKPPELPAHWSAADKEKLAKLPADAQQFVLERHRAMEAEFTRKSQEIAAFKRDYAPVDELFRPYQDLMRQGGHSVASMVQGWIGAEKALMDQKAAPAFIADVLGRYGIDKNAVIQALGGSAPRTEAGQPVPPPEGAAQPVALPPEVAQKLDRLEQWQRQQETERETAQRQQFQTAAQQVMSTIDTFRSATDAAGNLLHPHFAEVESDMGLIADVMRARGERVELDDLYNRAVWANTSIREKTLASQRAADEAQRTEAEQKRQQEARAKAERARRAAAPVTGASSTGTQARRQSDLSLRETLLAAAEEHAA